MAHLSRRTTSIYFRKVTEKAFPNLNLNKNYWSLFEYLLFGTFRDSRKDYNFFDEELKKEGKLVISREVLAKLMGRKINNFCANEFLLAFQRDVMSPDTFQWSGWSSKNRKARVVTKLVFPETFQQDLELELKKFWHPLGRVYFRDGSSYSRSKQRAERNHQKKAAETDYVEPFSQEGRDILNYMNALPPNLFTKILGHVPAAYKLARAIESSRVRTTQLNYLGGISDQPQPFYRAYEDTDRIYGIVPSIPWLTGDIRRTLTAEWAEADLKNAQLAICASLWQIDGINNFLRTGESIWNHLFEFFPVPLDRKPLVKPVLKKALYSLCYGMRLPNLKRRLTKGLKKVGIKMKGEKLFESPLINLLVQHREEALRKVESAGGAETCFGKRLKFVNEGDGRKILAQVAQAEEVRLIHSAFRFAQETDEFTITLFQHDGFSAKFKRRDRIAEWKYKIKKKVDAEARLRNIVTELEWKD